MAAGTIGTQLPSRNYVHYLGHVSVPSNAVEALTFFRRSSSAINVMYRTHIEELAGIVLCGGPRAHLLNIIEYGGQAGKKVRNDRNGGTRAMGFTWMSG